MADSEKLTIKPPFKLLQNEEDIWEMVIKSEANIITFHRVLEHLRYPNKIFEAFQKSDSKFMFFSVPLFSSVFIENIFPMIFPRHLGGGHTHLYTHKSLNYLFKKFKLEWCLNGSWYDSMDLRRSLILQGCKNSMSENALKFFENDLFSNNVMDQIQEVLDRNHSAHKFFNCKKK